MKRILLGLGSNNDFHGMDSLTILMNACRDLVTFLQNPIFSSVYKTKPMYVEDQNDFYNMVVYGFIADEITPQNLLEKIHEIEAKYGRDRSKEIRFGQRSLDIDIEIYGDEQINTEDLQIPHIRLKERAFVLIPGTEVLKKTADVILRDKFSGYLKQLTKLDKSGIKKIISSKKFCKKCLN